MTTNESLSRLPRAEPRGLTDAELLIEVKRLAAAEREATADLIRSLCEVEARQLHLAIGCSSMFSYCTQVLHLSEHAAYARIAAARHHRVPFADGGPTTVDNLELRCRAHNVYEAERWFGPLFVREAVSEWARPPKRAARRWGLLGGVHPSCG